MDVPLPAYITEGQATNQVGKCPSPNRTSLKYWGYNLQQICIYVIMCIYIYYNNIIYIYNTWKWCPKSSKTGHGPLKWMNIAKKYTDQDFPPGIPAGRPEGTSFETSDRGSRSYVNRDLSAESMQYALVSYYGAVEMFTALNHIKSQITSDYIPCWVLSCFLRYNHIPSGNLTWKLAHVSMTSLRLSFRNWDTLSKRIFNSVMWAAFKTQNVFPLYWLVTIDSKFMDYDNP